MGKVYILRIDHDEYERLIKLVKRDEAHRIKNREFARKKATKTERFSTLLKGPIKFDVVSVLEKQQNQELQLVPPSNFPYGYPNPYMFQYIQQPVPVQVQTQTNITPDVKTDSNSNPTYDTPH